MIINIIRSMDCYITISIIFGLSSVYTMNSELYKKLEATIKGVKCKNKGCLSAGNDNLELVWFGEQYE